MVNHEMDEKFAAISILSVIMNMNIADNFIEKLIP